MKDTKLSFLGVVVISFILFMPQSIFAGLLEDALYMGRLRSHTRDVKNEGGANYLKAILGEEPFEGRNPTGIKDVSAYIRGESAMALVDYADQKLIQKLGEAVNTEDAKEYKESEYTSLVMETRNKLYIALLQLKLKCAPDKAVKEKIIVDFLKRCALSSNDFGAKGIPLDALTYIVGEAQDRGVQAAKEFLGENGLQKIFEDDQRTFEMLRNACTIIDLFAGKNTKNPADLKNIYTAAVNSANEGLQAWAVSAMAKDNTPQGQSIANTMLTDLLARKNGASLMLKQSIDEGRILRGENSNFSFEDADPNRAGKPLDWSFGVRNISALSGKENSTSAIIYPAGKAASFAKCVRVKNVSGGTTKLLNKTVIFPEGKRPRGLEFGLSYKMAYNEVGLTIIPDDNLGAGNQPVIRMSVRITTADGIVSPDPEVVENAPFAFNWESLFGRYNSATPIVQAIITVQVEGPVDIYLDDIFLRRSENEFINSAPRINSLSVLPTAALPGTLVELRANVTDDNGDKISGHWVSNKEGDLDHWDLTKVSGSGTMTSTVKFTKAGEHYLQFTARDSFGFESIADTKITVLSSACTLTSNKPVGVNSPVNGTINLGLSCQGIADMPGVRWVGYLFVDGVNYATIGTKEAKDTTPLAYTLDTRYLADGLHRVYAKVVFLSNTMCSQPISSETLLVEVNNQDAAFAPEIILPEEGARIYKAQEVVAKFPAGAEAATCKFFLSGKDGRIEFVRSAFLDAQGQFHGMLNPLGYSEGPAQLTAEVSLRSNGKPVTIVSDPVGIVIARNQSLKQKK